MARREELGRNERGAPRKSAAARRARRTRRAGRSRLEAESATPTRPRRRQRRLLGGREAPEAGRPRCRRGAAPCTRRWSSAPRRSRRGRAARGAVARARGAHRRAQAERTRLEQRRVQLEPRSPRPQRELDADLVAFDELRTASSTPTSASPTSRPSSEAASRARDARRALDAVRADAAPRIARATAETDLGHLAASCVEALEATLDEVARRSRKWCATNSCRARGLARRGRRAGRGRRRRRREPATPRRSARPTPPRRRRRMTPEDAIASWEEDRAARAGQHDGHRAVRRARGAPHVPDHAAQGPAATRSQQTGEAIKRIDKTTRERFHEAFATINGNFEDDLHDAVRRRPRRPGAARRGGRRSRAASTSSRSRRASACRTCSCSRAARRR